MVFPKNYYPTPKGLAKEVLQTYAEYEQFPSKVLEPSAGTGSFLEGFKEWAKENCPYNTHKEIDISVIEKDPNFQAILKKDGYKVVHDDFLTFHTYERYNLIIMNPPFENGDEHFLKAISLLHPKGVCICILNAETIRNPYTHQRKILAQRCDDAGAKILFKQQAFASAERKTNVEIAIVTYKNDEPETDETSFIWENLQKAEEQKTEEMSYAELAIYEQDEWARLVDCFNMEMAAGTRFLSEYANLKPYLQEDSYSYSCPIKVEVRNSIDGRTSDSDMRNNFAKMCRRKYWSKILGNKRFTSRLTSSMQENLQRKLDELMDYDFSLFNLTELERELSVHIGDGIEKSILATFDKLSGDHSWYPETKKNAHYFDGWATNKAHKINSKVIIPIHGIFADFHWEKKTDQLRVSNVRNVLEDIERSMDYLDLGESLPVDLLDTLRKAADDLKTKNIECKYFNITLYKKGTCHITFTNQRLLDKLNIYGSQRKGWLPPAYGKKKYTDMSNAEKTVIDSFQGESAYSKVLKESNYYLANPDMNKLLIEA